jgi:hypothetical protein
LGFRAYFEANRHSGLCPLLSGEFFAVLAGKLKRRHSSQSWNDELMALDFHGKFSMRGTMPAHF